MTACSRKLTTPVVHEADAEDVVLSLVNGDGLTELVSWSSEERLEQHTDNKL